MPYVCQGDEDENFYLPSRTECSFIEQSSLFRQIDKELAMDRVIRSENPSKRAITRCWRDLETEEELSCLEIRLSWLDPLELINYR